MEPSIFIDPPIPTPPAITNDPVEEVMELLVPIIFTIPDELILPPTFKVFPIPKPPGTTNAPSVVEIESIVPLI